MKRIFSLNFNVAGDGEEIEDTLDLSSLVKDLGDIAEVISIMPRGPAHLAEVRAELVEKSKNKVKFSFFDAEGKPTPLQRFQGNNGYTFIVTVAVK